MGKRVQSAQKLRPSRRISARHFLFEPDLPQKLLGRAENQLRRTFPNASCTTGVTTGQQVLAKRIGIVVGLIALLSPELALMALEWIGYSLFGALISFRAWLIVLGWVSQNSAQDSQTGAKQKKTYWPKYTVLVPVFNEARAIPKLVAALKGLDYPKRQLDILFLLEEEDQTTFQALEHEALKSHFRIVRIPKGRIQTKPRALNYGLQLTDAEFVCIYDAEDQMHSGQLKAAVHAFQSTDHSDKRLACVQAPLVPHNGGERWIAGQFEAEYLIQFGLIVPGLTLAGLPVLLGGTSNHFRRDALLKVGGWDPFNVTEDADLGFRLATSGYSVGSITPPTYEEAPLTLDVWINQRSRWVKGYIQTLGVFWRSPRQCINRLGIIRWLAASLLLAGSILSAIVFGPLFAWTLLGPLIPGVMMSPLGIVLCCLGFTVHCVAVLIQPRTTYWRNLRDVLTVPVYWSLQSRAAYKAVRELFTAPYFWNKTDHGLTDVELNRRHLG